jgi:hypothetical protein
MSSIIHYTGMDLASAGLEGSGFILVESTSSGLFVNGAMYLCGEAAVGYENYKLNADTNDRGLRKDSEQTIYTTMLAGDTDMDITADGTTATVADGDYILVNKEIILIGTAGAATISIQSPSVIRRAQFGTLAGGHTAGTKIYHYAKGDIDLDFFRDIKALTDTSLSIDGGPTLALHAGLKLPGKFTKINKVASNGVCLLQRR